MAISLKWTRRLSWIGLVVFLVAMVLGDGGHGYVAPLIIGFPWMTLCTIWATYIPFMFIVLGMLQFPLYGLLIDTLGATNQYRYISAAIWVSHFVLAVVVLIMRGDNWR
jgi:hypothetical protein